MMSGFIVACARPGTDLPFSAQGLGRRAARLLRNNITPRSPLLLEGSGARARRRQSDLGSSDHRRSHLPRRVRVGAPRNWSATGSQRPDGSYAVCRLRR